MPIANRYICMYINVSRDAAATIRSICRYATGYIYIRISLVPIFFREFAQTHEVCWGSGFRKYIEERWCCYAMAVCASAYMRGILIVCIGISDYSFTKEKFDRIMLKNTTFKRLSLSFISPSKKKLKNTLQNYFKHCMFICSSMLL